MNYRHIYHAGSFVDVFKHVVLTVLIQSLLRKEKAFCYFDTHAGIGRYDLQSIEAQKTKEYETGVSRIISQDNLPIEIKAYLSCIQAFNGLDKITDCPQFYPGSPAIARHFLRPQDRMVLAELHPQDVQSLKQQFRNDRQVAVHHQDGYQALKAFLPPIERRGLVLIDPPYEDPKEFARLINALQTALRRWETGIYAVWYPIKDRLSINNFYRDLKSSEIKNILLAELSIYPEDAPASLNGCGMAIINPPWQMDEQLTDLLPWLWQVLSPQRLGGQRVEWLNRL